MSPKSSHPCPHCACSLHPHLHPHVEGLEGSNKDAKRLGPLEPCHRVKLSYLEGRTQLSRVDLAASVAASRFKRAGTPPTWNWRNLFRTPSARSGATAPCRKRHGQRTKVSVMHQNMMLFYCLQSSRCFPATFQSVSVWAVSVETVNGWLTKGWDVSIELPLKGLLISPHAHYGYCAVCEWIWVRGCSLVQIQQAQPVWKLQSTRNEHLWVNTSALVNC